MPGCQTLEAYYKKIHLVAPMVRAVSHPFNYVIEYIRRDLTVLNHSHQELARTGAMYFWPTSANPVGC